MIRSIYSGVSGMRNHQTRMDVIGNNIANVNTTGFKYGRVNFADQVSQLRLGATAPGGAGAGRGGVNPQQVGLGMLVSSIDTVMTQGNLQTTGKITDVAIQGDGFYITSDGPNRYYTRAGNFDFDREGNLVQPATGLHVMGWMPTRKIDGSGEPYHEIEHSAPLTNLKIPLGVVIPPRRTTEVVYKGNLDQKTPIVAPTPPATDPRNYYDTSTLVYDELGNEHHVTIRFTHAGVTPPGFVVPPGGNAWNWQIMNTPGTDPTLDAAIAGTNGPAAPPQYVDNAGTAYPPGTFPPIIFDANGLLADTTGGLPGRYQGGGVDITWDLPDGQRTASRIIPNFGDELAAAGLTQFSAINTAVAADQNGFGRGELTAIAIDKVGTMNGIFSNGRQQLLGQFALASFTNPGGLMKEGENSYIRTTNSGDAVIRVPGQAEAGTLTAGALEMSNVDLAEQFSDMIITQRGFQANSRVITTSDEVLQELLNLKR